MCVEGVGLVMGACTDFASACFIPLPVASGFWLLLVHPLARYGIDVCIRGARNRRQLRAQQARSTGRSLRLCSRRPPWACCISHGAVSRKVRLSYRSCSSFPSVSHSPILLPSPHCPPRHIPAPKPGFPLPPCRSSRSYRYPIFLLCSSAPALLLSPLPLPPLVEVFHPRVATARACCCCGPHGHGRSLTCPSVPFALQSRGRTRCTILGDTPRHSARASDAAPLSG